MGKGAGFAPHDSSSPSNPMASGSGSPSGPFQPSQNDLTPGSGNQSSNSPYTSPLSQFANQWFNQFQNFNQMPQSQRWPFLMSSMLMMQPQRANTPAAGIFGNAARPMAP